MDAQEQNDMLIRIDERTAGLVKSMDNHLLFHQKFEETLETRLDELASRNVLTPFINLFKWLYRK